LASGQQQLKPVMEPVNQDGKMDHKTIESYDTNADEYAKKWALQGAPDDLYGLLGQYFSPGLTADIGCGTGRDVAWLSAQGFAAAGFDASANLLAHAKAAYPELPFFRSSLPLLAGVDRGIYQNILCETVIMHLPSSLLCEAVDTLVALLRPGGTIYLSWRVHSEVERDETDRLYTPVNPDTALAPLYERAQVLLDQEMMSASSGKRIRRIVARKQT